MLNDATAVTVCLLQSTFVVEMTDSCEFIHQGKPVDPKQYIGEPAAPREPVSCSC